MKELIVGAGVAASLGLYLGNLAQPQLALDAPAPMEPVAAVFTGWDDGASAAYAGPAPDHVIGSDWAPERHVVTMEPRAAPQPTPDEIELAYEERAFAEAADSAPQPEAPPAAPTYPPVAGDILAGTNGAAPPAAIDQTPEV